MPHDAKEVRLRHLPEHSHEQVGAGGRDPRKAGGQSAALGRRRGGLDPARGGPSGESFDKFHDSTKGSTHLRRAKKQEWC